MFGNLFGTKEAVDNLVDKDNGLLVRAGTAFSNLYYSDQEKANDSKGVRDWGTEQLRALHPFKVTQRILAFGALFLWLTTGLNIIIMIWIDHSRLEKMMEFGFSDFVWWPTALVFGLYFAGGAINSLKGGK